MLNSKKPAAIKIEAAMVAVSGHSTDEQAVRFAAQLTDPRRGKLYIVHVIEMERSLPIDSDVPAYTTEADDLLDNMEQTAKPFKREVHSQLLQARKAGHAIVHEAVEREVDMVVIGMPYKTQHGRFTLGDAAPYVLEHAPCSVVLWRVGMPDETNGPAQATEHADER